MANLDVFRERIHELYRRVLLYDGRKPTQQDLADAVGLSRIELSRRLNGYGVARLTHQDARSIIRTLAVWEAICTQSEALELFSLADCPPFTTAEWQSPPLDRLGPGKLVSVSGANAAAAAGSYLPQPLTSFVGREAELAEIIQLVTETRLLTLAGAGGSGKTRLALVAAQRLSHQFPDGTQQIELARLRDERLLMPLLASAFGLIDQSVQPLLATVVSYLQAKRVLLILDNCEHLVGAVADLAHQLLTAAPNLVILTTSREALRTEGETIYQVPPLSLPGPDQKLTITQMASYEAIRLFSERARLIERHFELNQANFEVVREICERLDGLPLAIELAAARLAVLSVEQIAERIDDRFQLLTSGSRTVLPRQQTLKALIDWSYDLLSPVEQVIFAKLAIFPAGFSLAGAEAVCSEGERFDLLDPLSGLISKSLVIRERQGKQARYRMLETIRQYAAERLQQLAVGSLVRTNYIHYYMQLAQVASDALITPQQSYWFGLLTEEQDNLRYAISLVLEDQDGETALQLTAPLWRFWMTNGSLSEGRSWLDAALTIAANTPTSLRAKALGSAGSLAIRQGNFVAARSLIEQSLATP